MANRFMNSELSQQQIYEQKYKTSRMNLLSVVIITAMNLLLLITSANSYFLFSAFIPYFITSLGMLMCGRFPEEYYTGELEGMTFIDGSLFPVFLAISIAATLLYLIAWYMSSKNRVGWLIFALVFFGLDTLGMLLINGIALESIFDILFHICVIYYLILGISAHYKLKELPPEEAIFQYENIPQNIEGTEEDAEDAISESLTSNIIREADKYVKHRVLLETRAFNYEICYRRIKHTNELVINGNVYDEIEGVLEFSHILKAWVDGHQIVAGFTGTHSIISVDGEIVAKKLRLF